MRAADLFRKYRESINPPYTRKDLVAVGSTALLLLVIPLTVLAVLQVRQLGSRAAGLLGIEAENATPSGPVTVGSDTNASGGQYIEFGSGGITGTAYYVDCNSLNDSNSGTSEASAWKTLTKASAATLNQGDGLLLKRSCTWTGPLNLATNKNGIIVDAYGSGAMPTIQNANPANVVITGSNITIKNIYVFNNTYDRIDTACRPLSDAPWSSGTDQRVGWRVGFDFKAGATYNTLQNSKAEGMTAGVYLEDNSQYNKILTNQIVNNTLQSVLTVGGNDDAGTFGVLLHGDDNEIANNTFSGQAACTYDYGTYDGSDVEIFRGQRNNIHHNISTNSNGFSELGGDATTKSADNTYAYNKMVSNLSDSHFLTVRGSGVSYGPTYRTKAYNNTIYVTGSSSQGFVCHAGCSSEILTFKNNIVWADWKVGYSDAAFDESNNLYWSTDGSPLLQFTKASSSKIADPLFVANGSDLHLQSASPAINAGTGEVVTAGYNRDLDNKVVPAGSAPDMGVYEYGAAVASSSQGKVAGTTDPFKFVAWGDTKAGTATSAPAIALAALSNQANALSPAFALYSGDLVPDNITSSLLDIWKNAINGGSSPGNGMFNKTIPVRGNHDWSSVPVWTSYFDMPAKVAALGGTNYSVYEEDRTFSFDYGNSHFVGIDINTDVSTMTSGQISWLDSDLSAAEGRGLTHAFLYWHGPIYPISEHCCPTPSSSLVNVLNNHPIVSATFHGHEHLLSYIHIDSSRLTNITHPFESFIAGNAGVDHTYDDNYETTRTADYSMTLNCPKSGNYCTPAIHGFVTVDVSGTSFTVNAYKKGITTPVETWTFDKGGAPPLDTEKPTAPTNLTATAASPTSVSLSWTASTDNVGVSGYKVFRNGSQIGTSTTTTYSDNPVQAGTTYSYYVTAYDAAGNNSAASNTATATTPCASLPTDKGVATTTINITEAGAYKIWSRVMVPDAINNSYILQVDNDCGTVVGDVVIAANTWTWVDYKDASSASKVTMSLTAGSHTIKMIGRETGVKLDRLILTTDQACVPTGTGDNCTGTPPPCVSANPTVSLSPASQSGVAGSALDYTFTVTNNDSSVCGNSTFSLSRTIPSGWSSTFTPTSLTLAPEANGSSTLRVTSSASASPGSSTVTATATNSGATSYNASASAVYQVSTTTKPGDIDGDGDVDIIDLSTLITDWGKTGVAADINDDGTVDVFDLSILLSNWGS